jgi:beta-galactosidase GanA
MSVESSLASTQQMRDFLNKIALQDKVLLIGDTRQHQGVDAGKPFEQLQQIGTLHFTATPVQGPAFYHGTFQLSLVGDTFLDMRGLGKGAVWVNGHPLGRFWNIGPQRTLYLPGVWLRQGVNDVVVFELFSEPGRKIEGIDHPILNDQE